MASAFERPGGRWFARYRDHKGVWRSKRVRVRTMTQARAIARRLESDAEMRRHGLLGPEGSDERVGVLLGRWCGQLVNRAASDDRSRVRLHILPRLGALRLADVTLARLMEWIDDAAASGSPTAPTLRHCLSILSRFYSWAIARGLAAANPVLQIPAGRRPRSSAPRADAVPWISDDAVVVRLMEAMPDPYRLVLYVGNRAGLRLGEILGLRLGDVAEIEAGSIRVRHSYTHRRLKEGDRSKWCPAPADALEVLGPWIARRRAETSDPEAFLFPGARGRCLDRHAVHHRWSIAAAAVGVRMSFYQATRHSFASRCLSNGAPLDQVSAALGHSTPAMTARHYAHFVRRTFSPLLTAGLSTAPAQGSPVSHETGAEVDHGA